MNAFYILICTYYSQFCCNMCNKLYTNRGSLWQHKTSAHEGVRYPCDQCNSRLVTMQLSSEDTKPQCMKELDIPVISVMCQSCVLRQQKASVHEGDHYKCNICNYKAAQKEYL